MKIQSLAGAWEFQQAGGQEWLAGTVPGGVHTDLLALGRIPDPFAGDNEKRLQWVAEADWVYQYRFACSGELLVEEKVFLVCDGLDTLATVELNGLLLGKTDNMFRRYEWEVKSMLRPGVENVITITFASAVRYIAARHAAREMPSPTHSIPGGPYLRKAPCQFGWDWGPKLPPVGIWKDIRLEGYSEARLDGLHLRQKHVDGQVSVIVCARLDHWGKAPLILTAQIKAPGGELLEKNIDIPASGEATLEVPVPKPELWWPNGYGEQSLYQVQVGLQGINNSKIELLDRRTYQLGLRTIELQQQEDQWGRSFVFVVNGVPIFAKGANWIPADSFPTRITTESLEYLIRSAAETHQNMLRVWGGGLYEDEHFYDLCDRYGILVWQEFIFSCSIYPLDDPAFLENIHQEVVENVRRLRHRASLALWCGNNEMEWGWVDWSWNDTSYQDLKAAYDQFFHHTLPAWCQAEDPDHTYWPSSPSSETTFIDPNGQRQGDTHYWDVWHKRQPFTAYRGQYPRFMSEFGFQSLPPLSTIRNFATEADWNMTSYTMEQHQKNASGNSLMVGQMLDTFQLPKDFEALVYLSMVLQAEGIRYGVEHWRRHPDRIAGTLYWQLNDCWPVASWSSLDYFGRWKALHYAARRFYAPLLLSIEDNPPQMAVHLTNDTLGNWHGRLEWQLTTLDGTALASETIIPVECLAQSAKQICSLDFSKHVTLDYMRQLIFIANLRDETGAFVAQQLATFVPVKHLSLANPGITPKLHIEKDRLVIALTSQSLALLVEVGFKNADVIFSDNYFNLLAGETMQVTCPLPDGWTLERAKKEISLHSVYDSYAHVGIGIAR